MSDSSRRGSSVEKQDEHERTLDQGSNLSAKPAYEQHSAQPSQSVRAMSSDYENENEKKVVEDHHSRGFDQDLEPSPTHNPNPEPIGPTIHPDILQRMAEWEDENVAKNPFLPLAHGNVDFDMDKRNDLSDELTDLSLVEDAILSKADFITQWQDEADANEGPAEQPRLCATYHSCMDCFRAMLPAYYRALQDEPTLQDTLYRDCVLLHEWGVAYSVLQGQLDELPPDAKDMTDAVLSFLTEISTILIQRKAGLPKLMGRTLSVGESARSERPVVKSVPLMQPVIALDDDTTCSENEEDSENDRDTWEQCVAELHDYIVLLHKLHPSIESWVTLHETNPEPFTQHDCDHPGSQLYASMVKAKFQKAPEDLVIILGALNYDRFTRLADDRKHNQGESAQAQEVGKGSSFHDSGIGSSLPQSDPANARSQTPSRASSVAFTLAGQSRTRFPQLPRDARYNSFARDFCGKTVAFQTRKDYEKHLLKDLQPYSCLELECPSSNESFPTRKDWLEHLQTSHGLKPDSPAQLCRLCGEMTDEGMIAICRHLAEHLEAIALAASPTNIGSDDESDADSTKSHGHERIEDDKLSTIAEEPEETVESAKNLNLLDQECRSLISVWFQIALSATQIPCQTQNAHASQNDSRSL